jgi:hypothetical protein
MPLRDELTMATESAGERWKIGTLVKIRNSGYGPAQIVELRGPLGPGGMHVYRLRIRGKPRPAYIEVREDQLEEAGAGA